ncbi:hypothetical protein KMZ93_22580 [Bradyrhizobium sediminis]|uniref:Uncharacterized protein n=1 Tax=Bradyrhizobium sediminis TaxID=2840469 RepID=A0A975NWK1_9BRAD|nr:hypothetical protein [Bradyrhizobium sediminis]QWG22713.1 hypothetical protein KMZ93_22580 [Bradyrhizobium sediminis]
MRKPVPIRRGHPFAGSKNESFTESHFFPNRDALRMVERHPPAVSSAPRNATPVTSEILPPPVRILYECNLLRGIIANSKGDQENA